MIWQISYDRDQLPIVSTMWSRFKFSVLIVFIIFVIFLTANILVQENSILYTKRINKLLKDTIRWTNQKLRQFNSDGDNSIMEDYSDSIESHENKLVKLLVLAYPRYLFLLIEYFKKLFFSTCKLSFQVKIKFSSFYTDI